MDSLLSDDDRTLIQAAINAVNIQLSAHASPDERINAGKVRLNASFGCCKKQYEKKEAREGEGLLSRRRAIISL